MFRHVTRVVSAVWIPENFWHKIGESYRDRLDAEAKSNNMYIPSFFVAALGKIPTNGKLNLIERY